MGGNSNNCGHHEASFCINGRGVGCSNIIMVMVVVAVIAVVVLLLLLLVEEEEPADANDEDKA